MASDSSPARPSTPQPKRLFSAQSLDENDLSTLPDPRSRVMSPANAAELSSPHHPDLDREVATLSTKLINAINHQTTLDDNLSATRVELEKAREKIRELEEQVEEQREMLAGDVWVKRKTVEIEKTKLLGRVAEEKKARQEVEQQKKKIEQELENLTAALFEEANKMVISAKEEARTEQEALQRKNDQLRAQLADTEGLLKSQQEQLAELKHVMEQMSAERDDQTLPTFPSSPGFSKFDVREEDGPPDGSLPQQGLVEPLSPSYPTSFTHLLQPVLRTDLAAYADFADLIRTSKRLSGQRIPSGGASSAGLSSLSSGSASSQSVPMTASSSSLPITAAAGATPPASSPQTPITPASSVSVGSSVAAPVFPPLKETRFYKRVLTEDIEPTLRLDTAPGLSWLARRNVIAAMTDGSLVVEPVPAPSTGVFGKLIKPELYPCALCGENRKEEEHLRMHRFRTSESGSSQRGYPLCRYCLIRVRSTCDFLGFLRIVKDGHWRAEDEDAEKAAWEESVRLREQMFWSRIGGGVVPIGHFFHQTSLSVAPSVRGDKSPRPSHEGVQGAQGTVEDTVAAKPAEEETFDEVGASAKSESPIGDETAGEHAAPAESGSAAVASTEESSSLSQPTVLDPLQEKDHIKRLSLTIPGPSSL
ncbi:hypothetical protein QBC46DRAFT_13446 [Diplogelasinospora grovesii]|uniref:GDP/GTP exchange factor Sec2 N-terminal domain-containing protein n=1 Tax=Diplogelasinospora grovesii TaxID=303347 RepID=A0AAN6NDS0_9PEZI|nr:hypothetical protein QBC46DRAFT_13446 [Diplogelasinospora grovesii]